MERYWPLYQKEIRAQALVKITTEYRAHLPVYVIARCPFTGKPISEPVDTFSLNGFGWGMGNWGAGWSASLGPSLAEHKASSHLRIVAYFLNLHGLTPDDLFPDKVIKTGPEVPSIMRVPMAAEDSVAVMHELPIGRYDDAQLQPRYSVYFISYFTKSAKSYNQAIKDWGVHYGTIEYDNIDYDLASWAKKGRLLWLKADDPELPLMNCETADFPYGNIQGSRAVERTLTRTRIEIPEPTLIDRVLNLFSRKHK